MTRKYALGNPSPSTPPARCCITRRKSSRAESLPARHGVALFRPERNARRFQESAERLAMPSLPEEMFLGSIEEIVRIDRDWIPGGEGSLYLRPFLFANETFLGVKPRERVSLRRHRLARRRLLQGRQKSRDRLAFRHLHPRGPRRHRCGQMWRQLCGEPGRASRSHRARAAIKSCFSTRPSANGWRSLAA